MPTVTQFINVLLDQRGDPYRFGKEVDLSDADPPAFDCSELVEWACEQIGLNPRMPDGSWIQYQHCVEAGEKLDVSQAIRLPGALLFKFVGDPMKRERPRKAHVAVSLGNGYTIEARPTRYGVDIYRVGDLAWTHAGWPPGLDSDS